MMTIPHVRWDPTMSFGNTMVILALAASGASALSQQYCSNQNTGSDSSAVTNDYQSNGACSTTCAGSAFAVVQGKSCWCSNYIPSSQSSTTSCSVACPGYPYENCGDQSQGLFGYVPLGPSPSGTQGAPAAASSSPDFSSSNSPTANTDQSVSTPLPKGSSNDLPSSSFSDISVSSVQGPVSTTLASLTSFLSSGAASSLITNNFLTPIVQSSSPNQETVTMQATVTMSPSVFVSYVSVTPSTPSSSIDPPPVQLSSSTSTTPTTTSPTYVPPTTSSTSSSSSTSSWSPTPVTQIETVTGLVKTLTITPTTPPTAVQTVIKAQEQSSSSFSQSPGKIAGVSVVVVLVCAAIIGAIIWFCLRRKRRNEGVLPVSSTAGGDTPQRRPSRLSQMGLIGDAAAGSQKKGTPPTITTTGWGPGNTNSAEKSPADTLDRRNSYPRVVDQRLEPTALWNPLHDNGSHVSVRSFRDDQDYSRRMLRIANPDDG